MSKALQLGLLNQYESPPVVKFDPTEIELDSRAELKDSSHDRDEIWATINVLSQNPHYPGQKGNEIRTTRYRWYSFVPLALFEQYRVLTNFYFLIVLVVCFLPWSPVNYLFQLCPVLFVLVVSMIKSLVEDLLKRSQDKQRNNAPVQVLRSGSFVTVRAKDIVVGDVIQITEDSMVPSDILLIASAKDTAYYSEANLNGETTVKSMQVHPGFANGRHMAMLERRMRIDLTEPDQNLTKFNARLRSESEVWPISIQNVLLRGVLLGLL